MELIEVSAYLIIEQTISLLFGQRPYARLADNDRRNDSYRQIISGLADGCGRNRSLREVFRVVDEYFGTVEGLTVRHVRFLFDFDAQM